MTTSNKLGLLCLVPFPLLAQINPGFELRWDLVDDLSGDSGVPEANLFEDVQDEDEIFFPDGSSMTGKLDGLSPESGLTFQSPLSPEPLVFKADAFREILLAYPESLPVFPATEHVVLTNGDVLPGELSSLDPENVVFGGMVNGSITLPRHDIRRMRVGIHPQRLLYNGPTPLADWKGYDANIWTATEDDSLILQRDGELYQDVALGSQFILRFRLNWETEPGFRLYFCDEGTKQEPDEQLDRYYIDINSGGIQVKREQAEGGPWNTLFEVSDRNEAFDDNMLFVELRCNRAMGTIQIYLDQRQLGEMADPAKRTTGTGLRISRTRGTPEPTFLSNLEVHTWDSAEQAHSLEKEPDGTSDTLIDLSGKRMSGTIRELVPAAEGETSPHFLFESPYAEEPVKIPAEQTSLLFFKSGPEEDQAIPEARFTLELQNSGHLSATSLQLRDRQVEVEHPLLGRVLLPREAILSIQALNPPLQP